MSIYNCFQNAYETITVPFGLWENLPSTNGA